MPHPLLLRVKEPTFMSCTNKLPEPLVVAWNDPVRKPGTTVTCAVIIKIYEL
jgi:hypothetical protein